MNENFYNQQAYYLIDVFAGAYKRSKIVFHIINNSSYKLKNAREVEIESKIKKINSITGQEYYTILRHNAFIKSINNKYSDNLDVVNSEIAALLNIPSSRVYHLEADNKEKGIINIGVKKSNEQQISIDKLFERIINLLKTRNMDMNDWMKDYLSIPKSDDNNYVTSEKDIISAIEIGINVIKSFFKLNENEVNKLKRNYIQMILFDLLTNNVVRSFNSYSILLDYTGNFTRFAPIYDYNNDIEAKKYYALNNVFIDRTCILSILYKNYYSYIRELSRGLMENYSAYLDSINLIIDSNMICYSDVVKKNININIDVLKSLELIHEEQIGESKLDIAMTQTSINLTAVNNNQQVHQKYDNLIKDNVEEKCEEEVKIKVEPKKHTHDARNIIIFLLGLVLLCGVGIGIAYLIMLYYE